MPGPFLFPFKKPDRQQVKANLDKVSLGSFSYDSALVGATRSGPLPSGPLKDLDYVHDYNSVQVGQGVEAYNSAKKYVEDWGHFQLGWAEVDPSSPIQQGSKVGVVARSLFLWTLNPLQILFVDNEEEGRGQQSVQQKRAEVLLETFLAQNPVLSHLRKGPMNTTALGLAKRAARLPPRRRFTYAHGTLKGHLLSGEERFEVEWREDDSVWYSIEAFSKPGHILSALTYPLARHCQRKFARESLQKVKGHCSELYKA